jgi:hypothetical protein
LVVHPADQVARLARFADERHLQHVFRNAFFHHLPHVVRYLVKTVRRAQTADALVRPPEIVILHPQLRTLLHILEPRKLRTAEKLLLDRLPEPLDFALRLRMVRLRTDVPDFHPVHLFLELRLTSPTRILTAVVRQHLRGRLVLRYRPPEHLKHVVRLLRHIQAKSRYKP